MALKRKRPDMYRGQLARWPKRTFTVPVNGLENLSAVDIFDFITTDSFTRVIRLQYRPVAILPEKVQTDEMVWVRFPVQFSFVFTEIVN